MSERYLGQVFDIHAGGLDLIFPHHENEIAQSRCAHGTDTMARYWLHNGFVQLEGKELARSPRLGLGVFDVGLHPRASWYLTGLDPYAGLAPGVPARYRVWTTGATMAVTAETATQVRVRAGGRTRELAVPTGRTVELRLPGCTAPDGAVLSARGPIKVLSVSPTGTACPTR